MTNEDGIDLSLTCAICLDVASAANAVETSCCHNLFCWPCIENLRQCPLCRLEGFQTHPAYFARRLIENLKVSCPNEGCTVSVARSNLNNHLSHHCDYQLVICPDPDCKDLKCAKKLFIEHLTSKHKELLLENYPQLWKDKNDVKSTITIQSNEGKQVHAANQRVDSAIAFDDRIEVTTNKFGRRACLGSTGKFYCGGPLDGPRCFCCDGFCGPNNGCNCSGCMLLDVEKRRLPRGWLVNADGASARCSRSDPTKFYCGRMVIAHGPIGTGSCGPTNGEQCEACQKLTKQRPQRYEQV